MTDNELKEMFEAGMGVKIPKEAEAFVLEHFKQWIELKSQEEIENAPFNVVDIINEKIAEKYVRVELGDGFPDMILHRDELQELLFGKGTSEPVGLVPPTDSGYKSRKKSALYRNQILWK